MTLWRNFAKRYWLIEILSSEVHIFGMVFKLIRNCKMHIPIVYTPHKGEGSTLGLIRPKACQIKVKSRGIDGMIRMTIVEYG